MPLKPSHEILAVLELSGQKNVLNLCRLGQLPLDVPFDGDLTLRKALLIHAAHHPEPNFELIHVLTQSYSFTPEFKTTVLGMLFSPTYFTRIERLIQTA